MKHLALIISTKGISLGTNKVETMPNWSLEKKTANNRLNTSFEVQQFLEF